jgi:hypothetical protein
MGETGYLLSSLRPNSATVCSVAKCESRPVKSGFPAVYPNPIESGDFQEPV